MDLEAFKMFSLQISAKKCQALPQLQHSLEFFDHSKSKTVYLCLHFSNLQLFVLFRGFLIQTLYSN